jgi:hypothetical protein
MGLSTILGKENTIEHLLPLFLAQLKDEVSLAISSLTFDNVILVWAFAKVGAKIWKWILKNSKNITSGAGGSCL